MNYSFEDFTEDNYRRILELARARYRFISYEDCQAKENHIALWRHDIDISVHRALKLAEMEYDQQVQATYFVHLHSEFYNALEHEVNSILRNIAAMGHWIGLHFDPGFYGLADEKDSRYQETLTLERDLLEKTLDVPVGVFSYHNPESAWVQAEQNQAAGMINTYGPLIRKEFAYCSDSNGFWRHRRLEDLLRDEEARRIHVLLHPEWWTPEVMSPRDRVKRCVDGRMKKQIVYYDSLLKSRGRDNVES